MRNSADRHKKISQQISDGLQLYCIDIHVPHRMNLTDFGDPQIVDIVLAVDSCLVFFPNYLNDCINNIKYG